MVDQFLLTKLDAATRQLQAAIRLLFESEDPIVVHTIAGAASILYSDLLAARAPERSWDSLAQQACALEPGKYFRIMRTAQNFLKHARDDSDSVLEFDPIDTESLIFSAVMNATELAPMTYEAQVFQLWYVASHWPLDDPMEFPFAEAVRLFGDLRDSSREQRLAVGRKLLREVSSNVG